MRRLFSRVILGLVACSATIIVSTSASHASLPFTCKYTAIVKKVGSTTTFDSVNKTFVRQTELTLTRNRSTSSQGVAICAHRVGSTLTVRLNAPSKKLAQGIAPNKVLQVGHYTVFGPIHNPKKGEKRFWTVSRWSIIP